MSWVLKVYSDPELFWDEVAPHLRRDAALNSLLLAASQRLRSEPVGANYQAALFDRDVLIGAVVCSPADGRLTLLPSPARSEEAAEVLMTDYLAANRAIDRIIGKRSTVAGYVKFLRERGASIITRMRQRVFRCTRVAVPAARPNLSFRVAGLSDLELLAGWRRSFIDEAFPLGPVRDVSTKTRDLIERRVLYVLERDGTPVSMAHWTRDLGTSCAVTGVYTPPSFRKKGYASLITARLTKLLLDSGKRETCLVANAGNLTSHHIYEAIGYEFVGDAIDVDVSWGKAGEVQGSTAPRRSNATAPGPIGHNYRSH